jgi:hypothetical protein
VGPASGAEPGPNHDATTNHGPLKERMGLTALWASWNGQFGLVKVQHILPRSAQDTYNITVDGSHSFSVDGIHLYAFHTAEPTDSL